MTEHDTGDVPGAFEMLLEEVDAEISLIKKLATTATEKGEFETAKEAITKAEKDTAFRKRVSDLLEEWNEQLAPFGSLPENASEGGKKISRRDLGKLKKGLRTRHDEFYRPILQALMDLGGSAKMRNVLDRVAELMKNKLKPVDHEPLPSDPEAIRWRNTAQWARYILVKNKLLKSDSPHGIWEITPEGSTWLNRLTRAK
ncbi:MAG: hypothetical protein CO107_14390 [Deltaproteobacteria bacterium CG_4_9_14_3_um_filter_51_14]|nr:MAG: hypothetical protein CO107_14390 [Deltaproteobacteria bacterium CG_4_9_14_3_um_filter_51_14]